MHLNYLKEHRPGLYTQLILSGRLNHCLADKNKQVHSRLDVIIRQMQSSEGVDRKMKAQDQMLWAGRMNGIRQKAEEIILIKLIYT